MPFKHFLPLCGLIACISTHAQQKGYYRSPAIAQHTVVFTAEGDLWKYDLTTGNTARITTNGGVEINPVLSADGKKLAFIGQYEGPQEIYVMDINGGVPRRVTYDFGRGVQLSGFTKEGKLLYRTGAFSKLPSMQLAVIDPATYKSELIPLAEASQGCYDDEGKLYFTRLPNQGSKTKRYKGGYIEQIWKFDGKQEAVNLTGDYVGTSSNPMYYNNRVYFISDRDGTMNLWSMDKNGKDLKQNTFSKGWDVQTPTLGQGRIVYQKGADIWLYDIAANTEKMLDITLLSDFEQRKPKWIKGSFDNITAVALSPNGAYTSMISRGRVFVSPAKSDRWVEVTRKSGIRCRNVQFINNRMLAVSSDESGEWEVWAMTADGSGTPKQITKNTKTEITFFAVSPNEKYIAYNDKNDVLRIADVATGAVKFTYDSAYMGTYSVNWSPDSRFLTYTVGIENLNSQIRILDMNTMQSLPITSPRLDSYSPAWSADSNWFYFISDRNLRSKVWSPWGPRQPEPFYSETSLIYAMPLDTAIKFPFIQTDSWMSDTAFAIVDSAQKAALLKAKNRAGVKHRDWARAIQSLYPVPVKAGELNNVTVADGYLYWIDDGTDYSNPSKKLYALKIAESKKYEPIEVATDVVIYRLSANRKKLLVAFKNKTLAIADANGTKINVADSKIELSNWSFAVNPAEDWKQMYDDAWRMMRDYFYDRKLHNVNWQQIHAQYAPLVARLTDRYELDNLLAQVVGELSALHTFVYGGDKRVAPDQIPIGNLGAQLEKTDKGLLIRHIYKSDPDYPEVSSPLNKPELRIREGDIITAVNNIPVSSVVNIAELLTNKVNVPVKLTLTSNGKAYEQVVKPFATYEAFNLQYSEWELSRRELVEKLSNNEFGYIHLRAMGGNDMNDFVKQFYPVFNRKGLILDVRHNNGGNIDSWVLEKLMRKAWMYWQGRSGGPTWNMQYAFRGHMVVVCDQQTASDGEAVTEGFRRLGLGKVIGMRTWGGEIWLSSDNNLVDNGIATAAETGVYGPEGKWLIEGHGVEPDIEVDNKPYETFMGKDAQLEYAIEHLKKLLKEHPIEQPKTPAYPDKSFQYK